MRVERTYADKNNRFIFINRLRNNSWKPYCVGSFNMGWWILVFYPEQERGITFTNIMPTDVKTHNTVWLP
jgi:hypothetical protein